MIQLTVLEWRLVEKHMPELRVKNPVGDETTFNTHELISHIMNDGFIPGVVKDYKDLQKLWKFVEQFPAIAEAEKRNMLMEKL